MHGFSFFSFEGTNGTQVWDTSFYVMSMLEVGMHEDPEFQEVLSRAYRYLDGSQMTESSPKCVEYYRQYNKVIRSE